ncbi:MAG: hypothetical protein KC493_15715 [Bacteriovoracaceae bacterium]|nr:hypothetical protein [Bacteriovoracaceae bacterium]
MKSSLKHIFFDQGLHSRGFITELICGLYSKILTLIFSLIRDREVKSLGIGSSINVREMDRIREFRHKYLLHNSSWSLDKNCDSSAEEVFIDRVSHHVVATKEGRIYGVIRITPFPFQCHRNKDFPNHLLNGKEGYFEFNNLVTLKSDKILNKILMISSAIYTFNILRGEGIVALPQTRKKHLFKRMGLLESGESFCLSNCENQEYTFLSSTFLEMTKINFLNFFSGRII